MSLVKKLLTGVGALGLGMLMAMGIGIAFTAPQGQTLDRESQSYTEEAIAAIATRWDANELLKRASPQLLHASNADEVRTFVEDASTQLGPLIATEGLQGQAKVLDDGKQGTVVTASYAARAQFARGEVQLDVGLVKSEGQWRITGFHVHPTMVQSNAPRWSI